MLIAMLLMLAGAPPATGAPNETPTDLVPDLAGWVYVTSSAIGEHTYVRASDLASARASKSNLRSVWEKDLLLGGGFNVSRSLINCAKKTSAVTYEIEYNSKGYLVNTFDAKNHANFSPVAPETVGEAVLNEVCRPRRRR